MKKNPNRSIFELNQESLGAQEELEEQYFALKMIKMENFKEGFPITAVREIKLLKQLHHHNIVNLVEIVTSAPTIYDLNSSDKLNQRSQVFLVFEYAEHDLQGVLEKGIDFEKGQFKCIVKQMLEGLAYLH